MQGKETSIIRGVGISLALFCVLAFAGPASAATPQRIYRDLADNGRLDHHYSKRDINRALHMPSLQRYELDKRDSRPASPTLTVSSSPDRSRAIPFTGIDLALFGGVGAPLLILGAGLGRLVRVREQELHS
jgi:hypothetical protein